MDRNSFALTPAEDEAIRFYMGDPAIVKDGSYRGGPEAYNTINALLHPGCDNEMDKAAEGRTIELFDRAHLQSYLKLIRLITGAMERYRRACINDPDHLHPAYRIDRASSLRRYEADGVIYGFFSACREGFLPQYAKKKEQIVLLKVERDDQLPYLDFARLFGGLYAKPEEAEILMPYGAKILSVEPMPLSEEEGRIYADRSGNPPCGKYRMLLTAPEEYQMDQERLCRLEQAVTDEAAVARISALMQKLTHRQTLTAEEIKDYSEWKRQVMEIAEC